MASQSRPEDKSNHDTQQLKENIVGKEAVTAIAGSDAHGASTKSAKDEKGISKKVSTGPLQTVSGIHSDLGGQPLRLKDETKTKNKKQRKHVLEREVSEAVLKTKETIETLLVSSEILPEEDDILEKEIEEEPPPDLGHSNFKFLKQRCGKLVNIKTWIAPWQEYNMLETEKSWKLVDKWAPTSQFIRYQKKLVVWRHERPLAQHIR